MSWTRRALLAAGASQAVAACALGEGGGRRRIIGGVRAYDREFRQVADRGAEVEQLADGFTWAEGPVWVGGRGGGYLLFSDVRANIVHRWSPATGVEEFLNPSGYAGEDASALREPGANGLILGRPGELLMCDSGDRAVASVDLFSRRKAFLAERYDGRRLNSPNDLAFSRSGAIYFTDPPFGLEGLDSSPVKELPFNGVFRLAPDGRLSLIDDSLSFPNGIALSPDETRLYVSNSDRRAADPARLRPRRARLMGRRARELPDGMAVDAAGRVFAAGPRGVMVLAPDGRLLGLIEVDRPVANCTFGEDGRTLFIAAEDSIARIRLRTTAAA